MPEQTGHDEQAEIKKRAIRRLVVAGALVIATVLALAMLSRNKGEAPPVATSTAPMVAQLEPSRPTPEAPTPETPVPPPPAPAAGAEQAAAPAPPPPEVINPPAPAAEPAAKPPAAHPPRPQTAQAPAPTPAAQTPSAPPLAAPAKPAPIAPAAAPLAQPKPAASTPVPPPAAPAPSKPPEAPPAKGFVVQLGLFSNPANAQQLQGRLAEHGIKAHTETRLYVGPFSDKPEAERAMAQIRALGINAVLAPAR